MEIPKNVVGSELLCGSLQAREIVTQGHPVRIALGALLDSNCAWNAYSKRSASSGLMEAAFLEGKIEKAKFSVAETTKATTVLLQSKTKGN